MPSDLQLDPAATALLMLDFHETNLARIEDSTSLLERVAALLAVARSAGVRVIHVKVDFRRGCPEISPRNVGFSRFKAAGAFDTPAILHQAAAPRDDEILVTKRRVSAFVGTDLDMVLRANSVETLIFTGVLTSGVVLSTLRHAADADFRLIVAADCCADTDSEAHRILLEKIFPRQAEVTNSSAIVQALSN